MWQENNNCRPVINTLRMIAMKPEENKKITNKDIKMLAQQKNISMEKCKIWWTQFRRKSYKLKKRTERLSTFKQHLHNKYRLQLISLKSELAITERFQKATRGWQQNPYRRSEDILANLSTLFDDVYTQRYRKSEKYKKRRRNHFAPTNIKLYYRKQRKIYFMHYIGKTISDHEYQELHLKYMRHIDIPERYKEAIEASFCAVSRQKAKELTDHGKSTKVVRQSAAVVDQIFNRSLYLPKTYID